MTRSSLNDFQRYADDNRPVPIGETVGVMRYVWHDFVNELSCDVRVYAENTARGPRCVDLRLQARPDGPPITSATLREIPLGRLLRTLLQEQIVFMRTGEDSYVARTGPESARARAAYRRAIRRADSAQRRWLLDEQTLRRVAKVYRAALAIGQPPTGAVATEFAITRGRAARWVKRSREEGHLGPAPGRRKAGERS
jgi:hypothetical protein